MCVRHANWEKIERKTFQIWFWCIIFHFPFYFRVRIIHWLGKCQRNHYFVSNQGIVEIEFDAYLALVFVFKKSLIRKWTKQMLHILTLTLLSTKFLGNNHSKVITSLSFSRKYSFRMIGFNSHFWNTEVFHLIILEQNGFGTR